MTYRERIAIEHPDRLSPWAGGGVIGCPSSYGYEPHGAHEPCVDQGCDYCWNRQAPPRKVKVREKTNGEHPC